MMGKILFVTHELTPMHQRKILVRLIGISFLAIGLWGVIASALNWSSLSFIKISISNLALDITGLAYVSTGYHLLRQREFGRVTALILSWLNTLFWFVIGISNAYTGAFAISAVSLFISIVLTRFLNQPETKIVFQESVLTSSITTN